MGLFSQYNSTFSVERTVKTGAKSDFTELTTDNQGFFQPISDSEASLVEGDYSKTYVIYFDRSIDVKIGDRIKIGTDYYYVNGIKDYNYGSLNHKKATIEAKNV